MPREPVGSDTRQPERARGLPPPLTRGEYRARFARTPQEVEATQRLRHLCFVQAAGRPERPDLRDHDSFDDLCDHVMIEDQTTARLLGCFRVQTFASGACLHTSYAAQYYDLKRLSAFEDPMVELGRFCVDPSAKDGDVLRIAWGMLAAYVDAAGAQMLFGCSSFKGTDATAYPLAFDVLADRHLAPRAYRPAPKADETFAFAQAAAPVGARGPAMAQLPPLLRTYLSMGGWVSDHAVIDRDMNTLHVFTGLEIAKIPPARAAALRAIAG